MNYLFYLFTLLYIKQRTTNVLICKMPSLTSVAISLLTRQWSAQVPPLAPFSLNNNPVPSYILQIKTLRRSLFYLK